MFEIIIKLILFLIFQLIFDSIITFHWRWQQRDWETHNHEHWEDNYPCETTELGRLDELGLLLFESGTLSTRTCTNGLLVGRMNDHNYRSQSVFHCWSKWDTTCSSDFRDKIRIKLLMISNIGVCPDGSKMIDKAEKALTGSLLIVGYTWWM